VNRPKHQHWVPQFYLRQFATPQTREAKESQVWVFSKNEADGNERLTNVRNVCGKRYLYTPTNAAGERVWQLETKLNQVETLMCAVWPALANDFVDTSDPAIREGLSLFVAIMHVRNPEVRHFIESLHAKLVAAYKKAPIRSDGCPDIESFEVAGVTYEFDPSGWHEYRAWGKNDHDHFFAHVVESEAGRIANLLLKKRWSVAFSDVDVFITSDKPVILEHPSQQTFGFATPSSIVMFPLSPKRLLVLDDMHSEPANQYYPLQASAAASFNHAIWRNGSRFMITGRPILEVLSELSSLGEASEHEDA
jgi:hypothetical protein